MKYEKEKIMKKVKNVIIAVLGIAYVTSNILTLKSMSDTNEDLRKKILKNSSTLKYTQENVNVLASEFDKLESEFSTILEILTSNAIKNNNIKNKALALSNRLEEHIKNTEASLEQLSSQRVLITDEE